jgi:uncharacterized membrane protein
MRIAATESLSKKRAIGPQMAFWLTIMIGLVSILTVIMPLLRYWALSSAYYDLGQYVTNYVLFAGNGEWGIALRSHAHPVMIVVGPIFAMAPAVETLLLQQSAVLLCGLFVYALLWQRLGAGDWRLGAVLAVLSISFWSAALLDYHFEHALLLAYVAFFLRLEAAGRWVRFELVLLALLVLSIKESFALTSAGLGLYLILAGRHRGTGFVILALSAGYFFAVISTLIPLFSDGRSTGELWHSAFAHLGQTPADVLRNLVMSPRVLVDSQIFTFRKMMYLCALFGPFLLVFWRVPLLALPALPHVAIAMLSLNTNHVYLANHYTIPVLVPCLVAAAYAASDRSDWGLPATWMERLPGQSLRRLSMILAFSGSAVALVLFGMSPVSRLFFTPTALGFDLSSYVPTARDIRLRELIDRHVPSDRALVVTMQNNLHTGRLSLRTNAFAFPDGVLSPVQVACHSAPEGMSTTVDAKCGRPGRRGSVLTDYVVLDLKRPWFIYDRPVGAGDDAAGRAEFLALKERLADSFERIVAEDGLEIWRRLTR